MRLEMALRTRSKAEAGEKEEERLPYPEWVTSDLAKKFDEAGVCIYKYAEPIRDTEPIKQKARELFKSLDQTQLLILNETIDACAMYLSGSRYTDSIGDSGEDHMRRKEWRRNGEEDCPEFVEFKKTNQIRANRIANLSTWFEHFDGALVRAPLFKVRGHFDALAALFKNRIDFKESSYLKMSNPDKRKVAKKMAEIAEEFLQIVSSTDNDPA